MRALGAYRADPTRANMERIMELFIPDPALWTEELVERRWRSARTPGHLEASARFTGPGKLSQLWPAVRELRAEVLCVWGQQDWMVPVEGAMRALAQIPRLRLHVWAGAGHFVQYERRDEFNRLVVDFLTHQALGAAGCPPSAGRGA
ncbi:MAG: alpha/beta fold hydrolase [SAR202 cluster bacterium]|nr:alpha/beta fold hydrolase [SAR202 cluster bacterium]